jgi:hypothetical protein
MNTDLVLISEGMTSQLQVPDVVVNKPFKDHLKQLYSEWLLAGGHVLTPTGKVKKPSIELLCHWIKTSWQQISLQVIVKGFKSVVYLMQWTEGRMIFCGGTRQKLGVLAVNMRV